MLRQLNSGLDLSSYFDADFYRSQNPNVQGDDAALLKHYLKRGWKEGSNPAWYFDVDYYLRSNPDIAEAGVEPLGHFVAFGKEEGRIPHWAFAPRWLKHSLGHGASPLSYFDLWMASGKRLAPRPFFDVKHLRHQLGLDEAAQAGDVMKAYFSLPSSDRPNENVYFDRAYVRMQLGQDTDDDPAKSFLTTENRALLQTHPVLDRDYVFAHNPQHQQSPWDICFIENLASAPEQRTLDLNPLMDNEFYVRNLAEPLPEGFSPLIHYLTEGYRKGYDPNPFLEETLYQERYLKEEPDTSALAHYYANGREPHITLAPHFSDAYYCARNPGVEAFNGPLLVHYLQFGKAEGRHVAKDVWADEFVSWKSVRDEVQLMARTLDNVSPSVSVIIPVYNQFLYTLRAVWTVLKERRDATLQIIIADDGSSDETQKFFCDVEGLTYVRNPQNLGFLRSCNNAATHAAGEYLFFLNNDTAVLGGAIDSLVETARSVSNVGLVGSKLVYPGGLLQEAGGYIWSSGEGANLGRFADPDEPAYNFLRDCDYISGAAILVPSVIWRDLGGFDELYAPAYCEDSDFAMKLRNAGYRVLYQPCSEVVHFEGISSGTSTESGIKSYQAVNQQKLIDKWSFALDHHYPDQQIKVRDVPRPARPRILVIDAEVPTPDKDAGSVTAAWFLKILIDIGYDVTFIPTNLISGGSYAKDLQRIGVEVLFAPYVTSIDSYLVTEGTKFDAFFLYRFAHGGNFAKRIQELYPTTPIIFDTVDLHYLRVEREAAMSQDPEQIRAARKVKADELDVMARADQTILLSQAELEIVKQAGYAGRYSVIPLVMGMPDEVPPRKGRTGIAFVGGFRHTPNVDAVIYFMEDIYPLLREKAPDIEVHIVGSNAPQEILNINEDNITVHGFVQDLDGFLDERIATIVPLQYGAGIKGKIGSSLAAGVPCISTPIGAEGMGLVAGEEILIGASPEEFVQQIVNVSSKTALWNKVSARGRDFVQRNYSVEVTRKRLMHLLALTNAAPFSGKCPITGVQETRRFLSDGCDSLAASPNSPDGAERIAASALRHIADAPAIRLDELTLPIVSIPPSMPRLALATSASAADLGYEIAVRPLRFGDETEGPQSQLRSTLDDLEKSCKHLILPCIPENTDIETENPPTMNIQALTEILVGEGWVYRYIATPTLECSLTGCGLLEASREVRMDD